jgi:hypothetical protein
LWRRIRDVECGRGTALSPEVVAVWPTKSLVRAYSDWTGIVNDRASCHRESKHEGEQYNLDLALDGPARDDLPASVQALRDRMAGVQVSIAWSGPVPRRRRR